MDAEGNKKAAVLDWSAWEELVTLLEKLEDQEAELADYLSFSKQKALPTVARLYRLIRIAGEVGSTRLELVTSSV